MSYKVYMIESERGWGSRLDETKEFPTEEEAITFADTYNKTYNNQSEVPDWYIRADLAFEPTVKK